MENLWQAHDSCKVASISQIQWCSGNFPWVFCWMSQHTQRLFALGGQWRPICVPACLSIICFSRFNSCCCFLWYGAGWSQAALVSFHISVNGSGGHDSWKINIKSPFLTLIIHNQLTISPFFKYVTKNAGNGVAFEGFGVGNGSM